MSNRIACANPECNRTILPVTAERTGGYCMPCVQAKARAERDEYIRKNRRDVDPYEGLNDPLEMLKVVHRPQKPDPLIRLLPCPKTTEALYAELDASRTAALLQYAVERLKSGDEEQARDIARCLTALTSADINPLLRAFIQAGSIYPGFMFLRAAADVRESLIEALLSLPEEGDCSLIRNHLLMALAWIGDERVVELFGRWRATPPSWASTLFIPPEKYAEQAGWQLSADLQRKDLYYRKCYPLVAAGSNDIQRPVMVVTESQELCPRCARPLTRLFHLDGTSEQLAFLGCPARNIDVPACEYCFDLVFGRPADQVRQTVRQRKVEPDDLRLPQRRLMISRVTRSPWHAADFLLPTAFSQLGGHPSWIQDAEYPACPECRQTMMFVGQVACEDIDPRREGIFYGFLCPACRTTASCYQQT